MGLRGRPGAEGPAWRSGASLGLLAGSGTLLRGQFRPQRWLRGRFGAVGAGLGLISGLRGRSGSEASPGPSGRSRPAALALRTGHAPWGGVLGEQRVSIGWQRGWRQLIG